MKSNIATASSTTTYEELLSSLPLKVHGVDVIAEHEYLDASPR
jgi:hypothetical protein